MSVVRVLCFVAVLHCMSAFVLQSDGEKVNQEKNDIKRIIELLRKENLQKLADTHIDELRSTLRNVEEDEEPEQFKELDIAEEEEMENSLSLFENSETRGFLEKNLNNKKSDQEESQGKEEKELEEAEDLQGRSLLDTDGGHGAEIDGKVEPEDNPELFSLLNSFLDEKNGVKEQGAGLNQAYKAQKDGMDSHRLTHEQKVELGLESENPGKEKRNFITNTNVFWPNGIVPYEISSDFSSAEKTVIETAIAEMATKTCVQFLPKAQTDSNVLGHDSYISFFSERTAL
ncbi:tolloid-like protein 1 [Mizuhopecten yessoensis]|uniref:tolloid-like protein 1 n=1 Tax=Mizuhopecten yessoensis TaxID=6573 RepID=UPI000B45BB8B|nr:tolloid-like protein 1 [Mizuhopecten yessoensis]